VLVPGFTQTASSWRIDGATTLDVPVRDSFVATALALGDAGGRATYAGYSMGGRLCLRLALERPDLVDALVLVSATAGLRTDEERAARVASDEALAQSVEHDGVSAFLERWLAQPMFAGVPHDAPGLADRRSLTVDYLTHCLRVLGTGRMEPVWDRLGELTMPVLIVTGTRDAKFDAIGAEMAERITGARHVGLDGGHALPLEAPDALAATIADFVNPH
jgi:2-succinyl-6-hydroxy-2,4-cyclohexadiene-1-carboxylate synthase